MDKSRFCQCLPRHPLPRTGERDTGTTNYDEDTMKQTHNGAPTYEHSLNHALEFFSKAGSLFEKRGSYYGSNSEDTALSLFQKTWIVDPETSLRLLFWLRDARGGAGNRSGFRSCLRWLAHHAPDVVRANLKLIPEHGRWDDLIALYDTPCEEDALALWAEAINASTKGSLACKWAGRHDKKLRRFMGLTSEEYRKLIVAGTAVVEQQMCARKWNEITYEQVPSIAMARYSRAFHRHDDQRYQAFKDAVSSGEKTVHTGALFPHDCVRTARGGDPEMAQLQFDNLPNYVDPAVTRVLCICDTSGSMSVPVSGSITAYDVSVGMSLYFSDKIDQESPFYRKFLQFESESTITDWSSYTFSEVIHGKGNIFTGAVGSTNIARALKSLLSYATMFSVTPAQMPTMLLIISDMQFDSMTTGSDKPVVEAVMQKWRDAGYQPPSIVYWNTAGYAGSPATITTPNTSLISGFSPSILKLITSGKTITPQLIMEDAIAKYQVTSLK